MIAFPPLVKSALESDLDQIRGLGASPVQKQRMLAATIKRYQVALQINTLCSSCGIRPIYDVKCRQCSGLTAISWKGVY